MKSAGLMPKLLFCSLLSVDAYALWPDDEARCFIQKAVFELRQNGTPAASFLADQAERVLGKEALSQSDIEGLLENIDQNIRLQLEDLGQLRSNTDISGSD